MEDLKVKVSSEAESKEAQELLFELGYKNAFIPSKIGNPFLLFAKSDGFITWHDDVRFFEKRNFEEITLPQLRDLVVLKRNNVNDATHTDQDGWKWYVGADSYVWQAGNSQQLKQWDQSSLAMVDLEPIEKKMTETEHLMQGKNGERLMESVGQLKGMKYDNDKPRHSLLPKGSVNAVIDVLEFGAKKYEADNWQKVDNAKERYYNAAMRHIDKWWNGEKRDPETNIHHLAHAATNLFFLMWFDENGE